MLVKFLSNKGGGSSASIKYALSAKRVKEGTARILEGDPNQTKQIIDSLTKKQKVSFGVMSFEEANIPEAKKKELMREFEKTFFSGLDKSQYNVLWVEHTDKGRLELNAIIPKVELSTGRAFNPYNHKTDLHIKDLFTKKINLEYGFTDPNDPSKSQSVQGEYKKTGVMKDYVAVDELLHKMVKENTLSNRDEIVQFLEDNGIKVTRQGKDYLSIKLDDKHRAKRLKGGIYEEQFRGLEGLAAIGSQQEEREREFAARDTRAELEGVSQRLSKALQKRSQFNQDKYSKPKQTARIQAPSLDSPSLDNRGNDRNALHSKEQISPSTEELDIRQDRKRESVLHRTEQGELEHDRARESVTSRIRSRETALQEIIERNRTARASIHRSTSEDIERLYPEAQRAVSERRERRTAREYISRAITSLRDTFTSFGERFREKLRLFDSQSRDTIQSHKEHLEQKNRPSQSWGMSMRM